MPGHIIRKYREMRNYSQRYVSNKMGISQNAYSKIENNITQLTVHHVKELSKILDVPVTDLLNDEFEIHKPVQLPSSASKKDLLAKADSLKLKIQTMQPAKHDMYIAAMSLMIAAENTLQSISTS